MTHTVLVEGLQNHVTRAVGSVTCATHGGFTVIAGMPAKTTLIDAPLGGTVEGKTHFFKVEHGVNGFFRHNLCRILIDKVVAALDGVKGMPLPVVFLHIGQSGAHTALCRTGVRAGGV